MKSWELTQRPELMPVPVDTKKYTQNLAELAELLYYYFCSCQSHLNRSPNLKSLSPALCPGPKQRGSHE